MAVTTNLGITLLEASQAEKTTTINDGIIELDRAVGEIYGYSAQTANYTVLKSDRVIPVTPASSMTITLPATTGATAPHVGQRFMIYDASVALILNGRTITIAVPSGKKLDGVVNGTSVIYGDSGHVEVMFVSDSAGYVTVTSKGLLSTVDDIAAIGDLMNSPTYSLSTVTLPTASNHTPGYIPFTPRCDVGFGIDQIAFVFASVAPSSDASNASIRYGFYASDPSTRAPSTLLWSTEDALLQGSGHLRSTADSYYANVGSVTTAIAIKTLSARRLFKAGLMYYLGYHLQPTFSAGNAYELGRTAFGMPVRKLNAGAQAWPYTMASSPTTAMHFGGDTLARLQFGFRFRRLTTQ